MSHDNEKRAILLVEVREGPRKQEVEMIVLVAVIVIAVVIAELALPPAAPVSEVLA